MKVIRKIKPTINRSSSRIKSRSGLNSTRGVINKTTPRTASLVLLPSLAVLAMFMVVIISVAPNASAADDDSSQYANSGSSSIMAETSTTFSIEDEKSIGVTLSSNEVILNINPTSSGTFNSASMTVDVSTNNITGYNSTMTADKTDLSRTIAINGTTPTIPTIPTGKTFTEDTFENGYWGYKVGTTTDYLPMTTDNIPINTTDAASNSSISIITFASKLNNSTPSGTYSGVTLSFVATTNIVPLIMTLNYMQDIATLTSDQKTELLTTAATNTVYQLKDNRDETTYSLAKLADGNLWMLDNLALDLTTVSLDKLKGNTNATDASLGYLKNGGGTSPYSTAAVVTGKNNEYTKPIINTGNMATIGNTSVQYGNGSHKYGVLYNYCAASAGSYCYASGAGTVHFAIRQAHRPVTVHLLQTTLLMRQTRIPCSTFCLRLSRASSTVGR